MTTEGDGGMRWSLVGRRALINLNRNWKGEQNQGDRSTAAENGELTQTTGWRGAAGGGWVGVGEGSTLRSLAWLLITSSRTEAMRWLVASNLSCGAPLWHHSRRRTSAGTPSFCAHGWMCRGFAHRAEPGVAGGCWFDVTWCLPSVQGDRVHTGVHLSGTSEG